MKILLDPTHTEFTTLEVDGRILQFAHARRDCGARLIQKLARLKVTAEDELAVVVGPGNFTAVRTACLVGNAVKLLTHCELSARRKTDLKFKKVANLEPYYATAPAITVARK